MWWRSGNLSKHLPLSLGPHAPAAVDVMSGVSLESTFIRLYYPSALKTEQSKPEQWIRWSPHEKYIEGLSSLVNNWANLIKIIVWLYGDAIIGEPLVPAMWEAEPLKSGKKFPVIMFSHGYGATRFLSSTIANELASRGFVVASIEHRENSACATYYYECEENLKKGDQTWIPHKKMEFGPDHYKIRNAQLKKRSPEIVKLIDFLEKINNGTATNILNSKFDLGTFKDRLDLSSLCAMGHSFGGATSLLAMAQDDRIACGVILDGWMFPLKDEKISIKKPLLFINTQTFHIESNIQVMDKYLKDPAGGPREIYTLKHTTHESQTDTPHIIGYWLNWFMVKLDPIIGTNINNHMTLRFLKKYIGFPEDTSESEAYLKEQAQNFVEGTFLYTKLPKRKL